MVRKIIFKNTSNNKNQTKNIAVPKLTEEQLAPILTEEPHLFVIMM